MRPLRWAAAAAAVAAGVAIFLAVTHEADQPTWTDAQQVDAEIVEISAELELLETDTFATAWDLDPVEPRTPTEAPEGQSRGHLDRKDMRHG